MYSKEAIQTFLKNQEQLFSERVADEPEEAQEFLEDCMAVELKNIKEVKNYLYEMGADVSGMSPKELEEQAEVFRLPGGRYLVVEG